MWAALEAHAPFTDIIKATRRVRDDEVGWLKMLVFRGPGDFPHVQITLGDNLGGSGPPFTVLANEGVAPTADWDEERTSDIKVSILYETPGYDMDTLEMTLIEALEATGRNLGYAPIYKWGPWRGKMGTKTIDDIARPATDIVIPVIYRFAGTQLTP